MFTLPLAPTHSLDYRYTHFFTTSGTDTPSRLPLRHFFTHSGHRHSLSITGTPSFHTLRASTLPLGYRYTIFSHASGTDTPSRLPVPLFFTRSGHRHSLSVTVTPIFSPLRASTLPLGYRYAIFSHAPGIDTPSRLPAPHVFTRFGHRHSLSVTVTPFFHTLRASTLPLGYRYTVFSHASGTDTASRLPTPQVFTRFGHRGLPSFTITATT